MFVDRRRVGGANGQTLVSARNPAPCKGDWAFFLKIHWRHPQIICCEGNAGFYEVGCMNTPLEGKQSGDSWPLVFGKPILLVSVLCFTDRSMLSSPLQAASLCWAGTTPASEAVRWAPLPRSIHLTETGNLLSRTAAHTGIFAARDYRSPRARPMPWTSSFSLRYKSWASSSATSSYMPGPSEDSQVHRHPTELNSLSAMCSSSLWDFPVLVLSPFLFTATWAVMSYPDVKAVVLDASFDDLLPLAFKVMPDSWSESNRDLELHCSCL